MRYSLKHTALLFTVAVIALGCQSDQLLEPVAAAPHHPELAGIALRVTVDVRNGEVRVASTEPATPQAIGPAYAILGTNEVALTSSNFARSGNNKVTITFDVAIRNRLTSSSLVAPTFPAAATGLLLFPMAVTQVVGGMPSQVSASADWNGDGTPGSGAPRNFFNDYNCPASSTSDCFRWEQYPAPLGPGVTTPAQKVGFVVPKAVQSFQAWLILAADISNDLPAVARIAVTPPSYVMNDGFPAGFSAVAYDQLNNPLPWATITWTSPDLTAVEFQYGGSLVGIITGPSVVVHGRKVGQTFFTVSSGGVSVVVPLDIQVNTIVLVQPYILPDSTLDVGEQVQAAASVKDNSGQIVPGFLPTWSSSDPSVATVDPATGLITATGAGTCSIIATAAAASGSIPVTVNPKLTGDISGTMLDLDGQPVPGATVQAMGTQVSLSTTTASDGSYAFINLPGGSGTARIYGLSWSPTGCSSGNGRVVLQIGGVQVFGITVDCPAGVSGRLTPVPGSMVPAGLTVELTPDAGGPNIVGVVQPDGSYSISGVPSGGYLIGINRLPASCNAFLAQPISLTQQVKYVKDWSVDCGQVGAITGTAVDADGAAVAGAQISMGGPMAFFTFTDTAGVYSGSLLPVGAYGITADKPGTACGPWYGLTLIAAGQTTDVSIQLDCPFRVTGTLGVLGTFPPNFIGSLMIQFLVNGTTITTPVLADGSYSALLPSAPAADMSLTGLPGACSDITGPVSLGAISQQQSRTQNWVVDCNPTTLIIGVADGGPGGLSAMPLINVPVTVLPDGLTGVTDQDGQLVFTAISPGPKTVSAQSTVTACGSDYQGAVQVQAHRQNVLLAQVDCGDGEGAVAGVVTDQRGNPQPNILMAVGPYNVYTDAYGFYDVGGLAVGPVFFVLVPSGNCPQGGTPKTVQVPSRGVALVNEVCP